MQVGDDMARKNSKLLEAESRPKPTARLQDSVLQSQPVKFFLQHLCLEEDLQVPRRNTAWATPWFQPLRKRTQLSSVWISVYRNKEIISGCCFKSLNLSPFTPNRPPWSPYANQSILFPGACVARGPGETSGHKVFFHLSLLVTFWFQSCITKRVIAKILL